MGRPVSPIDPTLRITGRAEMPSLEIYHEDLSRQELKVWNHPVAEAQQFSEDHMDELLSDRGLNTGLPPTNLSYAEFVELSPSSHLRTIKRNMTFSCLD